MPQGEEFEAFEAFARANDDLEFLQTRSKDVAAAAGLQAKPPAFALVTAFEGFAPASVPSTGHPAFEKGDGDAQAALQAFFLAEKLPPWTEFSPETQHKIFAPGIEHHVSRRGPCTSPPLIA